MSTPLQFDPPEPSELSELLSGYEVDSLLATGGMGAVYQATQTSLDRPVAIKLLPRELGDQSFREQFEAEARSMAKLNHPNLISIYDFGEADGMPYIVMELVTGKSLYQITQEDLPDQKTTSEIIVGICRGLAHAHKAGILHRDIKPANILLDSNGKPKIGDFGLASAPGENDESETIYGTPGYAAPEITTDAEIVGIPSDLYSVGAILYELLTGQLPGSPAAPPSSIANCDPRFDPIFRKATRRNSAARHQTANELAEELEAFLSDLGQPGRVTLQTAASKKKSRVKLTPLPADGAPPAAAASSEPAPENQKDTGKPKLVPLPAEAATKPATSSAPAPGAAPMPVAKPVAPDFGKGGNGPIIRNLVIIAILIPVLIFAWGKLKDKQAADAAKREAEDRERKALVAESDGRREAEKRRKAQEEAESKKVADLNAKLDAEKKAKEEAEAAKTPTELLAELKPSLARGSRDKFPRGTVDRASYSLFYIDTPMTWSEASRYAEEHGGHLATPLTRADVDVISTRVDRETERVWLGGGALARDDWGWVTGEPWGFQNISTSVGSCLSLTSSGIMQGRPADDKLTFFIQWSKDGSNSGSIAAQISRLIPTLGTPVTAWPPSSVAHQNRVFFFVHDSVSWEEADLMAATAGGHLAVASDALEAIFLRDYLSLTLDDGDSCWLGARREKGAWRWTTGEPWEKAYWRDNSPSDEPSQNALRFVNVPSAPGWDDAEPNATEAVGYVIEWSSDAKSAPSTESQSSSDPNGELNKIRRIARKVLDQAITEHGKRLVTNQEFLIRALRNWWGSQSLEDQKKGEAAFDALLENLRDDPLLDADLDLGVLPARVKSEFEKAIGRQTKHQEDLDKRLEILRVNYLKSVMKLRDTAEANGLKTQLDTLDKEVESVGQNGSTFRARFEN